MSDASLKIEKRLQPPDTSKINQSVPSTRDFSLAEEDSKYVTDAELTKLESEVKAVEDDLSDQFFLNHSVQASDLADPYYNTTIRPRIEAAYRSYANKASPHSMGAFDAGSPEGFIVRPKTRTIIQKYKAACRASFFSNPDTVSIEPENPSDKAEVVTAEIVKTLLNYRLTKTIPWKNLCVGAFDDAMTSGLCVFYTEWRKTKDVEGPFVDLIPLDNMRWHPSADWSDIVGTSPFLIMMVPYYVGELMEEMENGKFEKMSRDEIAVALKTQKKAITTKQPGETDPEQESNKSSINDYQTVVVKMHVHRIKGDDWIWYTLDDTKLLTKPKLLEEVHFHGHRPFIIGSTDIEAHTAYVTPFPELVGPLQDEMNILITQRRAAIDMTINPKWRVDSDLIDQLDPKALLDNAPGLVAAPKDSLEMLKIPDVTQNAYQEQQALDNDFNELAGNFNPQSNLTQRQPTDSPFRTNQMLNSSANMLVDDRLMCFATTAIEPLFRLLVLLEQHHETDDVLVGLVGQQAGLFKKHHSGRMEWSQDAKNAMGPVPPDYKMGASPDGMLPNDTSMSGVSPSTLGASPGVMNAAQIAGIPPGGAGVAPTVQQSRSLPPGIDIQALLSKELVVKVNVGLNATAPDMKLARLLGAIDKLLAILTNPAHIVFDIEELFKEVFALSGYGDGKRFMNQNQNPDVMMLRQQMMQLMMAVRAKLPEWQAKQQINREKIASNERIEGAKLKQSSAVELLEHAREMEQFIRGMSQNQPPDQGQPT